MNYTISQVSRRTGLTAHTLRYYDRAGLLPFVERGPAGYRTFTDSDLEWLELIQCLKGTGMHIRDIANFLSLCRQGDGTMAERLALLTAHKTQVLAQREELERHLVKINHKIDHYTRACQATQSTDGPAQQDTQEGNG